MILTNLTDEDGDFYIIYIKGLKTIVFLAVYLYYDIYSSEASKATGEGVRYLLAHPQVKRVLSVQLDERGCGADDQNRQRAFDQLAVEES